MRSPCRAIEKSLLATSSDKLEARLQEIEAAPQPRRAGLVALHSLVTRFPFAAARLVGQQYPPLGEGEQATVYRLDKATVMKIVKEKTAEQRPTVFTAIERRRVAMVLQAEHLSMARHHGSIVLPHEVAVMPHPFELEREAIVILQPFGDLSFLTLSDAAETTTSLRGQIRDTIRLNPGVYSELSTLVSSSFELALHTGLVADIVGADNVGIHRRAGGLAIVDAQPVPPARPDDQALALHHLERLGVVLGEIASAAV